jgi:hypothetical protein
MKLTIITAFFAVFSASMIIYIFSRIKRETIGFRSALVWLSLWLGIGFFSIFPGLLDWATRVAQMELRIFFVLLVAVFILFAIVFNLSSRLDRMQRNLERVVQELAMTNYRQNRRG